MYFNRSVKFYYFVGYVPLLEVKPLIGYLPIFGLALSGTTQ